VRIVHVHRIGGIGGSERHLLTLLPALAARGVEPLFVGLDDPAGAPEPFYEALERVGVPHVRLPSHRDLDPALAWRLPRLLRSLQPDAVHTHLVHADVYGAVAPGAPLVSTKHNPDPFRAGPFRFVERALATRARRVVAISEALRRFSVERVGLPAAKIDVVPYGLDSLPEAWGDNPDLGLRPGARILLCVCRLAPQKGVEVAIRALALLRGEHPDAVLVVLGEGAERLRLESLARDVGVADAVRLPGRLGDVATLYRDCEVVVHPVRWEGFGLAMLEAMLAGKPVVASDVASAPEIVVDGETGTLVPADDPGALAAALSGMLADPAGARRLGAAGLARARARFSVGLMAARTVDVYRTVTAA
jgi:glycosyltransferase involved in cell wall biosynthesis